MSATPRPDLHGLHILVVHDNQDSRAILGAYLEHLGATVTLARNAGEALAALTELHAHVIVIDISMPAIDGTELLRRARTLDAARRTRTPAIAFSGFTGKDHQEAAREAGFDVFVGKPADPLDIALHIQSLTQDV